jgi:hypothetical protein
MSAEDRFTKHKLLINSRNEAKKKPDFRSANVIKEEDSCLFLFISCAVSVLFALVEFLIVSVEECHNMFS